jgi:hypothetical protein
MLKYFLLIFISLNSHANLSYGDGSETCNWTTSDKSQRIYNCDSVTIGGGQTITFNAASDYIIIRSQGDVNILGTIDVSAVGTTQGPGGGAGGVCGGPPCSAVNGASKNGGQGLGGLNGGGAIDGAGGGGGSGGRYGAGTLPTAGLNGGTAGGGSLGAGAVIPSTSYFPESGFVTSFTGGAGGGAGGSGQDAGSAFENGGTGGAGGGGIIIIAKGIVNITGSIIADGSNGVTGGSSGNNAGGGGGGGGSGGAIYIIGNQSVSITGTVRAIGGTGGAAGTGGFDNGGTGGNGGSGRIRVDTTGASYTGGATNPVATQLTLPAIADPTISIPGALTSDIEYACAYKENGNDFLLQFFMGMLLVVILLGIPKALRRLRLD